MKNAMRVRPVFPSAAAQPIGLTNKSATREMNGVSFSHLTRRLVSFTTLRTGEERISCDADGKDRTQIP